MLGGIEERLSSPPGVLPARASASPSERRSSQRAFSSDGPARSSASSAVPYSRAASS